MAVACVRGAVIISIHAPREGCDSVVTGMKPTLNISIHAPREGCDSHLSVANCAAD